MEAIEGGQMTKDLALMIMKTPARKDYLNTFEFIDAVAARLLAKLTAH